jgi:ribosomal-protein-serine acetyltransferase
MSAVEHNQVMFTPNIASPQLYVDDEISLVRATTEHTAGLYRLIAESPGIHEGHPWMAEQFESLDTAEDTLSRMEAGIYRGRCAPYVVTYLGEVAGYNALHSREGHHAKMAYLLGDVFTGHGVITRAARSLAQYGFEELDLHTIGLHIRTHNTSSQAVARRLGAQYLRTQFETEAGEPMQVWEIQK